MFFSGLRQAVEILVNFAEGVHTLFECLGALFELLTMLVDVRVPGSDDVFLVKGLGEEVLRDLCQKIVAELVCLFLV
jgi:hypothetical protein